MTGSPRHVVDFLGTYGVPSAGEPIQYDALRIEHDQGDVEIVVYNRATCCSGLTARRSGVLLPVRGSLAAALPVGAPSHPADDTTALASR